MWGRYNYSFNLLKSDHNCARYGVYIHDCNVQTVKKIIYQRYFAFLSRVIDSCQSNSYEKQHPSKWEKFLHSALHPKVFHRDPCLIVHILCREQSLAHRERENWFPHVIMQKCSPSTIHQYNHPRLTPILITRNQHLVQCMRSLCFRTSEK